MLDQWKSVLELLEGAVGGFLTDNAPGIVIEPKTISDFTRTSFRPQRIRNVKVPEGALLAQSRRINEAPEVALREVVIPPICLRTHDYIIPEVTWPRQSNVFYDEHNGNHENTHHSWL